MKSLVREINKILTDAEEYAEMQRDFPLFGVGNLQDLLEAILKEAKTKFATVSWTIADLDEYDIPEAEKEAFLRDRADEIRDLLCERGNDIIATFAEMNDYKKVED